MKTRILLALCGIFFSLAILATLTLWKTPDVEAQSFEPFTKTFVLPASVTTQYIPACTTGSTGCIPNYKQVAHEVIETPASPSATCNILIDGSNDNSHFMSLAATSQATGGAAYFEVLANGYFPYTRLKILPCSVAQTITYIGFDSALPINFSAKTLTSSSISSIASIGTFYTPFVVSGFQCGNPASSTAYLDIFISPTTPASGFIYEIPIAAGSSFVYAGPPLSSFGSSGQIGTENLYVGAMTSAGGSTPATAIECNFEVNSSGPYYPFFPPSP